MRRQERMKNLSRITDVILLLPPVMWSLNGIVDLLKNGLYSYTFLVPFPFKIHAFTLLSTATFYVTTFLIIKPHKPGKNFLISSALVFLSNAVYELVYAIFMCNALMHAPPHAQPSPPFGGIMLYLPLVLGGILLLGFLNRRFHFLTKDRNGILLLLLCFSSFIAVLVMLNHAGFFAQVHLYLRGQTTNDPHNPLWILSKIICIWMFFPLLVSYSKPFRNG